MEKRNHEIFMQSPGRRYLAMPGKLLRRKTTSINGRFSSTLWSKKKWVMHRQKQKSIFESGAWTYISCNCRSTIFVFRRIIHRRREARATVRHVTRWKKVFYFLFSAAVTKTGGWSCWTTSLYIRSCLCYITCYITRLCHMFYRRGLPGTARAQ